MADTFKADKIDTTTGKTKKIGMGFSDPSGEMPTAEYHYKSSINRLATGEDIQTIDIRGGDPYIDIKDLYKKPTSGSEYGDVSVRKTKSGHLMVFDDTNGNESIMIKHRDGSGFCLQSDGTMVMSTKNNRITQVGGTDALLIEGDLKISCQNLEIDATGDFDLSVGGDYNLTVAGEKKETVLGSSREDITGNKGSKVQGSRSDTTVKDRTTTVLGKDTNIIKGDVNFSIGGHFDLGATGYSKITSEAQIAYTAPQIDIVGVKGQIALKQGIFGGASSFFYGLNYYGRSAKFSAGITAPTFEGNLHGLAELASAADSITFDHTSAGTETGTASWSDGTHLTPTNLIRDGKGPNDDSIKDHLSGDPRGIKKISIDASDSLLKKFTKTKYTVRTARAALKDPVKASNSKFLESLIEEGLLSDNYFQKVPPSIGRVTNGNSAYLPYETIGYGANTNLVSGQRSLKSYSPDPKYDPNRLDPTRGANMITSKTLLAAAIPISTFLAGENGSGTLNHLATFDERFRLASQLLLQTEVLKLGRNNEGRFKNHKIVVTEGTYAWTGDNEPTKGSIPDLRTNGQAITYELYDEQNRNNVDVSYEFAAYLSDQLSVYEKITLDYDTIEPNPTENIPSEKINTQIIVTMPKIDKDYRIKELAGYKLETVWNGSVQSNSDLVEVTLDTVTDIISPVSYTDKGKGIIYTAADFSDSARFSVILAQKINELKPHIRSQMAKGIIDYLALNKDDLRDVKIDWAFRSFSDSNKLKKSGVGAAGGNSWHNYGCAIDVQIYVDGVWQTGSPTQPGSLEEYTKRMRRSMDKFNMHNDIPGDSGHFYPTQFPQRPPADLRNGVISIDDYIDINFLGKVDKSIVPTIRV